MESASCLRLHIALAAVFHIGGGDSRLYQIMLGHLSLIDQLIVIICHQGATSTGWVFKQALAHITEEAYEETEPATGKLIINENIKKIMQNQFKIDSCNIQTTAW